MADLAAGGGEYKGWSDTKKKRVYRRMVSLIKSHVQHGFALAFLKSEYDSCVPDYVKKKLGHQYYPVAVDILLGVMLKWRVRCAPGGTAQYIFDRNTKGRKIREEIQRIEDKICNSPGGLERFGMSDTDGFSEQNKSVFRPLQAADLLAWQWGRFMIKETGIGAVSSFYGRWQMRELFVPTRYECGRIEAKQFQKWVTDVYEHETENGISAFLSNNELNAEMELVKNPRQKNGHPYTRSDFDPLLP